MIPRRLRLRNFLSYRDCELDFSGLQLATLVGRNGDGKSALLDAITWALWGEARGRVEDDRIYHGEHDMRVELDFEVDGDRYRVLRKRTRGRSGALDLFQLDDLGNLRPITGSTSRETQAELTRRLHMDHQTFINSVFLVQGRSNEFTTQTPSGARRCCARSSHSTVTKSSRGMPTIAAAPPRPKPATRRARSRATRRRWRKGPPSTPPSGRLLANATASASASRRRRRNWGTSGSPLPNTSAANAPSTRRRPSSKRASRTSRAALRPSPRSKATSRASARPSTAPPDIEAAYGRLREARDDERALAELAARARAIEDAIAVADREIAQERTGLDTRIEGLDAERKRKLVLVAGLPALREEEAGLQQERDRLTQLDAGIQCERDAASESQRVQAARAGEAGGYRARAQDLKDRESTLAEAEGEPLCPVCRKPLTPEELHNTLDQYRRERHELGEQYKVAQAAVAAAESSAASHEKRAADLQRERTDLDARVRSCEQALAASLSEARNAERDLPDLEGDLDALRHCIETEAFAIEARQRRAAACEELVALGYDRPAHDRARERLAGLEPAEAAYNELTSAKAQAQGLADRITEHRDDLGRAEGERDAARAALAEARAALDASQDVSARLEAVEDAVAERRDRLTTLDQDHGRLEERRATLDRIAARVEEAKDRLAAARDSARLHEELARALGRDGVQAMLIEQSLPALERIANALLDQLTEGRGHTQVSLHTQRENASGKTVETLDIHISDDLGTRDYEMYSGGEKFRVDFALRIALSRLLAMRSGASLPTLIIDEGFGSQDEEGRDRLVAAINVISSEFRLILLVTHIEDLRDQFDRRIEVTKDPERGSQAVVV